MLWLVLSLLAVGSTSYEPPQLPTTTTPPSGISASRRSILQTAVATGSAALLGGPSPSSAKATLEGYNPKLAVTKPEAGQFYFPTLTPPFRNRATYRYELGRNAWALEQLLVFANVTATVRTVVVKMEDGGLWVNGPQWPTGEYCALLDELGPVKHVVVPCNAFEHKIPTSAFVKKYRDASVWVTPGQYGPFGSCGLDLKSCNMGYRVDGVLPVGVPPKDALPPWSNEFYFRTLYVSLPENAGPVSEAAFLHRPSNTLITTDAVAYIPDEAPPIFGSYFDSDTINDEDFWPKSVLQAVFLPLRQGDGASIDEQWPGYGAIRGRLIRAPILRAFSDARAPDAVREWVNSIPSMGKFDRILTAHFASPVSVSETRDFLQAFNFLDGPSSDPPISCGDWKTLDDLNTFIAENNLGAAVARGFDYKKGCPP